MAYDLIIYTAYRGVLRRDPNTVELQVGNALFNNGWSQSQYVNDLVASPVTIDQVKPIAAVYHVALGRKPDPAGFDYFVSLYRQNVAVYGDGQTAMRNTFSILNTSTEFLTKWPAGMSNADFVSAMYQLAFGRFPDVAGLNYFVQRLQDGTDTRSDVAVEIALSDEFVTRVTPNLDFFLASCGFGDPNAYNGSLL